MDNLSDNRCLHSVRRDDPIPEFDQRITKSERTSMGSETSVVCRSHPFGDVLHGVSYPVYPVLVTRDIEWYFMCVRQFQIG